MQRIKQITMAPTRMLSIVCGLLLATVAQAAEPHFGNLVFSASEESGDAKNVFATDTPKIYLHAQLEDVDQDTKLSAAWIAEKTDAAPPNYKIDSTDFTAKSGMDEASFTLSKPNAGWPVGDYRVDLSINGKPATSAKFKVAK